jgi:hypothetical protein
MMLSATSMVSVSLNFSAIGVLVCIVANTLPASAGVSFSRKEKRRRLPDPSSGTGRAPRAASVWLKKQRGGSHSFFDKP